MRFDIVSLFPEYFQGPFSESILKRAIEAGILEINHVNIRDFADNKWNRVDDRPYGGGPGMVLMPEPVASAVRSVKKEGHVIYLSPQGKPLTAAKCRELARKKHLILLCGHYEGVDERVLEGEVDEEISIGDYVLTNGCLAAIVLVDAVSRFLEGVIGHPEAAKNDSFEEKCVFDCPHYTRPEEFEGKKVPSVLLSGNHQEIARWRRERAFEKTLKVRPELIK